MGPEKKDYMEFLSQEANSTHRKFVTNTNNLNSFNWDSIKPASAANKTTAKSQMRQIRIRTGYLHWEAS